MEKLSHNYLSLIIKISTSEDLNGTDYDDCCYSNLYPMVSIMFYSIHSVLHSSLDFPFNLDHLLLNFGHYVVSVGS